LTKEVAEPMEEPEAPGEAPEEAPEVVPAETSAEVSVEAEVEVSPAAELETLRQQLEEERRKAAENYDQYLRAVAELRNYKKRIEQEREGLAREASAVLVARLLPVLDDFDRAMAVLPDEGLLHLSWIQGVALIHRRLQALLEQAGLQTIEAVGKPFDPRLHEAILYEETPADQDGVVLADLQKGYRLSDRVLRPTLVKVGKAAPPAAPEAVEKEEVSEQPGQPEQLEQPEQPQNQENASA
jgi:molecular chaperone GrpE